jgi:DnaJ-domain-containing protein 1
MKHSSSATLLPPAFTSSLLSILEQHVAGIDEFGLVRQLAEAFPDSLFAEPDALRDPLKLFRVHFLLFHSLYRLADEMASQGRLLRIGVLDIGLEPLPAVEPGLRPVDPLRAYYLDWQQWAATQAEDVERLLDGFWRSVSLPDSEVAAALDALGLKAPQSFAQVRRRYRQLLAIHHPDRGGDTAHAQRINQAFIILKRYYRGS